MSQIDSANFPLPPEQRAIRDKCFHPSGTFVEFPMEDVETSIPARFEKIVRMYPDRLAVKMGDRALTYQELNIAANRIAHGIVDARGSGSEPVALLFDHGLEAIAAILGTLKAGKYFIALDPHSPEGRLRSLMADSAARVILTRDDYQTLACKINADAGAAVIFESFEGRGSKENPSLALIPEDRAMILYTSGSTGNPKGILRSHRFSLQNAAYNSRSTHITIADRLSLIHALCFGAAEVHLFSALLNGAALFPFDVRNAAVQQLNEWLEQEAITILHSPPALFRALAEQLPSRAAFVHLRALRLTGAPITNADFDLYKNKFPLSTRLQVAMGASEAGPIATAAIDHDFRFPAEGSPAGYAHPGKEIVLLDEAGRSVAPGEVGEIAVRSAELSGQAARPVRGGDAAAADPQGNSEPFYLTGDLGRMLPDGFLIHLGRKDRIVKIRGFRINLGEVEQALRAHPALRAAAVVAWDQEPREKYLAAYVVQRNSSAVAVDELRVFLSQRLPDYMLPSAFFYLDSLPSTNGKVDIAALAKLQRGRPTLRGDYVAPRTELEINLCSIWTAVLGFDGIGIYDHFFDLGGDSLSAMRVIARVRNALDAEVPFIEFYEAPTIAALASLVRRYSDANLQEEAGKLQLRARAHPNPLSLGQERLWFLEELEPHAHRYNLVAAYGLQGALSAAALEAAINQIVQRHEALRTVFGCADGKPFQVVLDALSITVPVVDPEPMPGETVEQAIQRMCAAESRKSFDLERGPLLRAMVVRTRAEAHVLVLAVHHLIFDAWSFNVFARELATLYAAALARQPSRLAPVAVQYPDFALWQRDRLQASDLDAHLAHWRKQLAEIPDLRLPTDRPRPQLRDSRASRQWFTVSPEVTRALNETAREAGATLFMTLLAAYQTLLFRYSGQDDICVGVPVAGRQHEALDNSIGFFLNMLVLRMDLSGDPSFRDLLARARGRCLADYPHQDVPFESVVEALQPRRAMNRHPLFQALFALRPGDGCMLRLAGLHVEELEIDPGVSRFDLELYIEERNNGLHGYISGSADLFDAATVQRMAEHYETLLRATAANPEQRISELPILTPAQRHRLLVEWNATEREHPKKCIHELFEEQVERTPDAVAVVYENQQLTYRELNNRSNQLARYLLKLGVGPEILAGICVEPSVEMIIGLLGTLKASGAYLPLDPNDPRLQFMLRDAQASVLLTQQVLMERWRIADRDPRSSILDSRLKLICLDAERAGIDAESTNNLDRSCDHDHLAYVIYTSGSTGKPKGVEIRHGALTNYLNFCLEHYPIRDGRGALVHSSIAFDATITGIYAPLLAGGAVYLLGEAADCEALAKKLREVRGFSLVKITPAHLALLNMQIPPDEAEGLTRAFVIGGENLRGEQIAFWQKHAPGTRLFNEYGPTETTVGCVVHEAGPWHGSGAVPVGRPIANMKVYILDAQRHPVPIGVVGEIYIGGEGAARGYRYRPEQTAERFIRHSFDGEPAQRLYRTGDLARYLPDGNIEFFGRIDNQVKIRGYRIELGEIENVLAQHPGVREAVVISKEDSAGDKQLVAYVVPKECAPPASELRAYLKAKLPDYMAPNAFVVLECLPLSANGKVDRSALPPLARDTVSLNQVYVAPGNASEQAIADIWVEILGVPRIGVHDNFFDLGGHSLKATQVVSRLRNLFQSEIPLRQLFEFPTIAELAAVIDSKTIEELNGEKLNRVLSELEAMSEEDAQKQLAPETAASGKTHEHE